MNQQLTLKSTNYLDENLFYNKFLFWVVRLDQFHAKDQKPSMSADGFVTAYRIQYGCGLRVSELLKLTRKSFNLNLRLLTIDKAKTGNNQKTTILPYDIDRLEKHFANYSNDEPVFPTSRMTMWRYAKDAGLMAGLNIMEIQKGRNIEGVWTHLMRKSCSKRMREYGADRELRMLKLRHVFKDAHDAYDNYDFNALLEFEDRVFNIKNMTSRQSQAEVIKN